MFFGRFCAKTSGSADCVNGLTMQKLGNAMPMRSPPDSVLPLYPIFQNLRQRQKFHHHVPESFLRSGLNGWSEHPVFPTRIEGTEYRQIVRFEFVRVVFTFDGGHAVSFPGNDKINLVSVLVAPVLHVFFSERRLKNVQRRMFPQQADIVIPQGVPAFLMTDEPGIKPV